MREKIVCIEWDDAVSNSGTYDKGDPVRFAQVRTRTVGHLIKSTSQEVIVSQDRFYYKGKIDGDRHTSTIPRKMIKRIIELKGMSNDNEMDRARCFRARPRTQVSL